MLIRESTLRHLIRQQLREASVRYASGGLEDKNKLVTSQVEFEWGKYSGEHESENYWVLDGRDELGDIQTSGDPYTYEDAGDGKRQVVSGPESGRGAIGNILPVPQRDREREEDSHDQGGGAHGGHQLAREDRETLRAIQDQRIPPVSSEFLRKAKRIRDTMTSLTSKSQEVSTQAGDNESLRRDLETIASSKWPRSPEELNALSDMIPEGEGRNIVNAYIEEYKGIEPDILWVYNYLERQVKIYAEAFKNIMTWALKNRMLDAMSWTLVEPEGEDALGTQIDEIAGRLLEMSEAVEGTHGQKGELASARDSVLLAIAYWFEGVVDHGTFSDISKRAEGLELQQ